MKLTIGRKALLTMLGVAVPSLLITSLLILGATRDILRRNSTRQVEQMAIKSVQSLDELVLRSRTTLMTIADSPALIALLDARRRGDPGALEKALESLEEDLLQFQRLDPTLQAIRYLDTEGNVLAKVREGKIIPRKKGPAGPLGVRVVESLRGRDFFRGTMALGRGEVWISDMERGKVEGEEYWCPAMVRFSTPLFLADGRRAGALILNVWGDAAGTMINRLISPQEGVAFLVERNLREPERNGIYLFHQDSTCEFGNQTGSRITVHQQYPPEIVNAWMQEDDGTHLHPETRDILAHRFYSPYGDPDRGWVLVVNARHEFFMTPMATVGRRILYSVLLALVLTLAAAVFFARSFTRPLQAVVEGTRRIGRDLSSRIGVESRDEVGYLASEIDRMAAALQENFEEKRRVEAQICHAEKLASVGEMAAGLAHELNTPLGNIQALASLSLKELEAGRFDPEALKGDLADIGEQTGRCSRIISGLLSFARKQHPDFVLQDVNRLVEEALSLVRLRQEKVGARVEFQPDGSLPYIRVDGHQVQQVFVNILLNAFDALTGGGTVTIRPTLEGDRIAIRFADDGVGIPPEHLRKIFDPFFTTKEVGKGTGLGLSVSYGIIESQGGTIEVASTPGAGSVFTVRLPAGVY